MSWTAADTCILAANVLGWPAIHLAFSAWITRWPTERFDPRTPLYRGRRWEAEGRLYETLFLVRSWKGMLPDGAALLRGGFRKSKLVRRDPAYLERFARETCRGELVHWITLAFAPLFIPWNPAWAIAVMMAYGILANIPCIVALRYNRLRLVRASARGSAPSGR
jgi:glycosyl-4,4'-diaponeurosporenoate acyltransferase